VKKYLLIVLLCSVSFLQGMIVPPMEILEAVDRENLGLLEKAQRSLFDSCLEISLLLSPEEGAELQSKTRVIAMEKDAYNKVVDAVNRYEGCFRVIGISQLLVERCMIDAGIREKLKEERKIIVIERGGPEHYYLREKLCGKPGFDVKLCSRFIKYKYEFLRLAGRYPREYVVLLFEQMRDYIVRKANKELSDKRSRCQG
jgi:hypothetical protein